MTVTTIVAALLAVLIPLFSGTLFSWLEKGESELAKLPQLVQKLIVAVIAVLLPTLGTLIGVPLPADITQLTQPQLGNALQAGIMALVAVIIHIATSTHTTVTQTAATVDSHSTDIAAIKATTSATAVQVKAPVAISPNIPVSNK